MVGRFRVGLPGVRGAQYYATIQFSPGAGWLAANDTAGNSSSTGNTSSSASPSPPPPAPPGSGPLLDYVELIVSIEPLVPYMRIDERKDYRWGGRGAEGEAD